jgi:D-alanyl-D-alanine endopeptidase (penicillin-binding protein 7)
MRRTLQRLASLLICFSFSALSTAAEPYGAEQADEPINQSVDPVFVSNISDLLLSLPSPTELPPDSKPPAGTAVSDSWLQKDTVRRVAPSFRSLRLSSAAALVVDQERGHLLYAKNPAAVRPIASITKLMTAVVVLDAGLPLEEVLAVDPADVDKLKKTRSRLVPGLLMPRHEMLKLALMASENRAAAALARTYPGGSGNFVRAMNDKARQLGMRNTRFLDSTGLNPSNVSTAQDLALLVNTAYRYPMIREFTTSGSEDLGFIDIDRQTTMSFRNTNALVRTGRWEIGLSKTGFINEAGRCLVMQATIATKAVIIILLDSRGKAARIADANRIKHWLERADAPARKAVRRRHADNPRV